MRASVYLVGLLAAGVAIVACGTDDTATNEVLSADVSEQPQPPETVPARTSNPAPSPSSSAESIAMWRCDEFKPQYIGGGLTVSLPDAAVGASSGGTGEDAPIHFGFSAEFAFDGGVVSVGRTIGSNIVPEPGFDKRVENGVVLFVMAADPELRSCVIGTLHYDAVQDEQD